MSEEDKVHRFVSSNPFLTVVMTAFLMVSLYYGQGGAIREGPDIVSTFGLTLIGWILLGVQQAREGGDTFNHTIEVLGLSDPLPGFNINMSAIGVGIALALFEFSSTAASVYGGGVAGQASVFQPLFNPWTAFPTQFSVSTTIAGASGILLWNIGLVAVSEELFKYIGGKNLGNAIYARTGLSKRQAAIAGFGWILPVWGLWHFLSWTLSIAAIFMAISYGVIFFLPWLLTDYLGSLGGAGEVSQDHPVLPVIVTHGVWNTLVGIGSTGLAFSTVMMFSAILIVVPSLNMLWISGAFSMGNLGFNN